MRPSNLKYVLLLPTTLLEVIAQQATTTTAPSASSRTSAISIRPTTTTGANRITYAHLPSCASSCISSALRSIPCTPFVASCFCPLPTGRIAYELPVECVREECGGEDIDQERTWRESVCQGITETTTLNVPGWTGGSSSSTPTAFPRVEVCTEGWKACPVGLNGGCCPSDNHCNILDCQATNVAPVAPVSIISSPSEVPSIDVESLFPSCSHGCISQHLLKTPCGLSPLNSTCFCRLHDFYPCLAPCSEEEVNTFVASHLEICQALWYFTPYDSKFGRWCDLVEGEGNRGRPPGYDARMGSLESKCPDWWEQRSDGKRFGIVLGIGFLSIVFLYSCIGYWHHVGKRVTETDKKRDAERKKIMGLG